MKYIATFFIFILAATGILSATPIQTVTADLVNVGKPLLAKNVYVGPYTLNVNGTNYAAMCIDFQDTATLNDKYSAYDTQLTGSLANTYNPTSGTQYKEEAYLMSLILQPNADRTDIQEAAWAITDSSYKVSGTAEAFVTLAADNYQKLDLSDFYIISGTDQCDRTQEFMIDPAASTATPEPSTMLLMGGGLVVAGIARRKMIKRA